MCKPTKDPADPTRAPLAGPGRRLGWLLAHLVYDGRALHIDRLPRTGPVIVVSNHVAFLDGPVVFCLAPRTFHFLVKRTYFATAWGPLLRKMGQIPIDQHSAERQALMTAKGVLDRGGALGVFPEGHRGDGSVEAAEQGAAWLALQTGALIVPVATLGAMATSGGKDSWPKPRSPIRIVFGDAFALDPAPGVSGRERLRLGTEQLRARLAAHVQASVGETGVPLPGASVPAAGEP